MEVINFNDKEFEKNVLIKYFTSGDQADIYLYYEDGQKKFIKKYRHPLDEKAVSKIKLSYLKADKSKMIIPEKLISIDDKIIGYLSAFKENYTSINNLDLNQKEKYNLLVRMKEILNSMIHAGIYFYDINAGNIGYKIAQRLGGFDAYGPIMLGLNAPINDLSRGCNASEVYSMAIVTAALA